MLGGWEEGKAGRKKRSHRKFLLCLLRTASRTPASPIEPARRGPLKCVDHPSMKRGFRKRDTDFRRLVYQSASIMESFQRIWGADWMTTENGQTGFYHLREFMKIVSAQLELEGTFKK